MESINKNLSCYVLLIFFGLFVTHTSAQNFKLEVSVKANAMYNQFDDVVEDEGYGIGPGIEFKYFLLPQLGAGLYFQHIPSASFGYGDMEYQHIGGSLTLSTKRDKPFSAYLTVKIFKGEQVTRWNNEITTAKTGLGQAAGLGLMLHFGRIVSWNLIELCYYKYSAKYLDGGKNLSVSAGTGLTINLLHER